MFSSKINNMQSPDSKPAILVIPNHFHFVLDNDADKLKFKHKNELKIGLTCTSCFHQN